MTRLIRSLALAVTFGTLATMSGCTPFADPNDIIACGTGQYIIPCSVTTEGKKCVPIDCAKPDEAQKCVPGNTPDECGPDMK